MGELRVQGPLFILLRPPTAQLVRSEPIRIVACLSLPTVKWSITGTLLGTLAVTGAGFHFLLDLPLFPFLYSSFSFPWPVHLFSSKTPAAAIIMAVENEKDVTPPAPVAQSEIDADKVKEKKTVAEPVKQPVRMPIDAPSLSPVFVV